MKGVGKKKEGRKIVVSAPLGPMSHLSQDAD